MIHEVITETQRFGACEKSAHITSWKSLAWLFFSSQGQEFCEKHRFPDMATWQRIGSEINAPKYGIFINTGEMSTTGREKVALIGDTQATCHFSTPVKLHTVILMHGARAKIVATKYAVVRVVKLSEDCKVEISKDQTSKILW